MTGCAVNLRGVPWSSLSRAVEGWLDECSRFMTKKYRFYTDKIPLPGGGFIEAMRVALVEFSCLGERSFDVAGYPHASEREALLRDWGVITGDYAAAANKVLAETGGGAARVGQGQGAETIEASKGKPTK